jgi:hypothetical protein
MLRCRVGSLFIKNMMWQKRHSKTEMERRYEQGGLGQFLQYDDASIQLRRSADVYVDKSHGGRNALRL